MDEAQQLRDDLEQLGSDLRGEVEAVRSDLDTHLKNIDRSVEGHTSRLNDFAAQVESVESTCNSIQETLGRVARALAIEAGETDPQPEGNGS